MIAVALTVLSTLALKASHPPAAATTLLVALGSRSTPYDAMNLIAGAIIMALVESVLRRLRLGRWPYRPATHSAAVAGPPAETQPEAPELKKAA